MNDADRRTWHGLQDVLGPKWSMHVLRLLLAEPRGFNAILEALPGLSAPVLSRRLDELQCHGLVDRSVAPTTPPTTTYSLTDGGERVATLLRDLEPLVELRDDCADDDCGCGTGECRDEALGRGCLTAVPCC